MSGNLRLHVYRRGQFREGLTYEGLHDPDCLAPMTLEKRRALLEFPLKGEDDEPVQIIGTEGDRVIGRMDLVPGIVYQSGQPIRMLWGSALSVPPAYRNTLMGVMLIMKGQSLHHTIAASGPSQAVIPVYEKLKWVSLRIPRYVMICRSRPIMDRYLGGGIMSSFTAGIADWLLKIHGGVSSIYRDLKVRGLRVEQVQAMSPEFDPVLAEQRLPVTAHRSAAWLNWQLNHSFGLSSKNRQALYYVRDGSGKVVGYFLNKIRFHETATHRGFKNVLLGSPQDWMVFDPSAVSSGDLLILAIRELLRDNLQGIELCTEEPSLRPMIRLLGFARIGEMRIMFRAGAASPLVDPKLHNLSQWWIRPADGDSFFT